MTQEEKAKAYDEAINRMKHYAVDEYGCSRIKVADVFPELAESEDERIRKALIDGFTVMKESKNCGKTFSNHNIPVADILAWLEKQGEQKSTKWSEKDESKRKFIEDELSCLIADEREIESPLTERAKDLYSALYWFKSIKDRYTWKPSDEQIEYLAKAITTLGDEGDCKTASILNDLRVELKKLRGE